MADRNARQIDTPVAKVVFHYRGTNGRGVHETGTIEARPERLEGVVKGFYKRRYRQLEVFDGDEQVGAIVQNEFTRRRTWWSA